MNNLNILFPGADTVAIAGLYLSHSGCKEFKLSDYVSIIPSNEEIDKIYIPRVGREYIKPNYYLIGIANDKRYWHTIREIKSYDEAVSSLTLAHLALCILHRTSYRIGPVVGFNSEGSMCGLILSTPTIAGNHWELNDEILRRQGSPLPSAYIFIRYDFNEELKLFFERVCKAYIENKDPRWFFSAFKYLSGITQAYIEDALVDLALAIEALVNKEGQQISFSSSLYMALLVGKNYKDRLMIKKDIQTFYKKRSQLVHGKKTKFDESSKDLMLRVSEYIAEALKNTCGKSFEGEVFPDLEFMSLLGLPIIRAERYTIKIPIEEIIELIKEKENFEDIQSYKIYGAELKEKAETSLRVKFKINGKYTESYYVNYYLSFHPKLKNTTYYCSTITEDESKKLVLIVMPDVIG